jgi:hypothetical protein
MSDIDFKDKCVFVVLSAAGLGLVCGGLDLCQGYSLGHAIETTVVNVGFWGIVAIVSALTYL